MKREDLEVVVASPSCRSCSSVRRHRRFAAPELRIWSINLLEDHMPELMAPARIDAEREARITALGMLLCSHAATSLWRRVCLSEMVREIRARSADQRVAMELALQESMR